MNAKKAKALRRKIREHEDADKIPEATSYVQRVMKKTTYKLGLDKDGKEVTVDLDKRQIRLGNCRRAIYQRVKKALR